MDGCIDILVILEKIVKEYRFIIEGLDINISRLFMCLAVESSGLLIVNLY